MDSLHILYLLSQACLDELSQNFREVCFSVDNKTIKVYFVLERMNDADHEVIEDEIISDFSMFIENFLETSQLEDDHIIESEIVINAEKDFSLDNPNAQEYFVTLYRRREES